VIQCHRPNKRVVTVTDAGVDELAAFAATGSKPLLVRDDFTVKVHAVDHLDTAPMIAQLEERADEAAAKLDLFERTLRQLRGDLEERAFLKRGKRIGPYLTCLADCRLERETSQWPEHRRTAARAGGNERRGTGDLAPLRRALGDSQTEGLGDGDEVHGYWADRFAELLVQANPGLHYANLAVPSGWLPKCGTGSSDRHWRCDPIWPRSWPE
jgi:Virulence activator alpha C-term